MKNHYLEIIGDSQESNPRTLTTIQYMKSVFLRVHDTTSNSCAINKTRENYKK
tara:strand:+ start:1196 stop:1354 length:159 start_codon:yes stop_codon:yes gene_type:complete